VLGSCYLVGIIIVTVQFCALEQTTIRT
jgi:hypothetical protein